jgi:hypothetical protein
MSKLIFSAFLLFILSSILTADQRRIGKRHDIGWDSYYQLGNNYGDFAPSDTYPDLSVVGALISTTGALGTATLVAPNYIVTAAHVIKNDYYESIQPNQHQLIPLGMGMNLVLILQFSSSIDQ